MERTTDFWLQPAEHDWRPRPTLSGRDHTSFEVWDEERERIWWGDWVAFGRAEEVADPGDYVVRDVAGESVFVVRSAEGRLNGFYNVCSHRGTKFLDDEDRGNRRKAFTCPYHAWTYDLDGRLIGTPNVRENELFDRSSYPLHRIAVDEYAGFVFVNLADRPRSADGCAHAGDRVHDRVRAVRDAGPADRGSARLRGRGELEDHRRELQRMPALSHGASRARQGRPAVPFR
ncbi:MAG: Rieske (2Fe-2S) protein [Actinobacteria bacterium]|nr:MAG: Rieske (2Fe-2S) protein [Actinomycetota bacterium]